MRVEHVRPFAEASVEVCRSLLGIDPQRGDLAVRRLLETSRQINAVCSIGGGLSGFVMLSMSARTANQIAGRLIGSAVVTFDQMAASAIAEFGNMVGGRSLTLLADAGVGCTLSPPTVIRGTQTPIQGAPGPAILIPLLLGEFGTVEVVVSLAASAGAAA